MIEEGILGECLRCSSSLSGLRISPLTLKYVLPRTTLLHSRTSKPPKRRCEDEPRTTGHAQSIISDGSLKPTKAETVTRWWPSLSHAFKFKSNDCFGRAFLVTVRYTGALLHTLHAKLKGTFPRYLFLMFTDSKSGGHQPGGRDGSDYLTALNSTTNPLTATALIYAFGAGITAGAGTRLVLQLLLDIGWR